MTATGRRRGGRPAAGARAARHALLGRLGACRHAELAARAAPALQRGRAAAEPPAGRGAQVREIVTEGEGAAARAVGVRLADGRVFRGRTVVSNATRWDTFDGLLPPERLPEPERLFRRGRRPRPRAPGAAQGRADGSAGLGCCGAWQPVMQEVRALGPAAWLRGATSLRHLQPSDAASPGSAAAGAPIGVALSMVICQVRDPGTAVLRGAQHAGARAAQGAVHQGALLPVHHMGVAANPNPIPNPCAMRRAGSGTPRRRPSCPSHGRGGQP